MNERYQRYKESYKKYREANKHKRFSLNSHHKKSFGGMREQILERDNWACVSCGLTNEQHLLIFARAITIDHINRNRADNSLGNLQTLCLRCHGSKDGRKLK